MASQEEMQSVLRRFRHAGARGLDATLVTRVRDVILGWGRVGRAAAEQLPYRARDAGRARVATRQPARLLVVRLQQLHILTHLSH